MELIIKIQRLVQHCRVYEAGGFHRGKERRRERERKRDREKKIENVAGHGLVGRVSTMIVVSLETE